MARFWYRPGTLGVLALELVKAFNQVRMSRPNWIPSCHLELPKSGVKVAWPVTGALTDFDVWIASDQKPVRLWGLSDYNLASLMGFVLGVGGEEELLELVDWLVRILSIWRAGGKEFEELESSQGLAHWLQGYRERNPS